MKTEKLLTISGIIIAAMMALLWYQDHIISKYKNAIESIDTTTTITVDTLYLEKTYTDTVPKYITQRIIQTDTIFKKIGDSISITPLLISLKKKKLVE